MDQFVEMTLEGKKAAEALPLVEDHLMRCKDCREEFEALRSALEAIG
jgi:predicted anti-sigma-YlaC factor YlaD